MKYTLTSLFFIFFISASFAATGKIWDRDGQKFISEKTLITRLTRSRNIMITLREDNPDHDKFAAGIIARLAATNRKPFILLGNVERNKQNAFAIFRQRQRGSSKIYDATGLDMLLEWSARGPPDWAVARPVFDVAMIKKLPLRAVAFSRYEIGRLFRNGLDGLPEDVKTDLLPWLSTALPAKLKIRMATEIRANLCLDLPPEAINKLILVDRARGALFAQAIARITDKPGIRTTVLIRPQKYSFTDISRYLDRLGVKTGITRLYFSESSRKKPAPKADYIWYSGKISRPDPCRFLTLTRP